jgi:hypothetical protein
MADIIGDGDLTRTAAVGQLSQVIEGIARGATDQARQVQTTSAMATEMGRESNASRPLAGAYLLLLLRSLGWTTSRPPISSWRK